MSGLIAALERARLRHLLGQTIYEAALAVIQRWRRDYPDNIRRLEQALSSDHRMTLEQQEQELQGKLADRALERFRTLHEKASGAPFSEANVIERPADAYEAVTKAIVEEGYSGIFVIADEFTHLLHQLAQGHAAPDVKAIDSLAEKAENSRRSQLHFYIVSLESFASAQGTDKQARSALERSGGRFLPHELKSQYTEELLRASIHKIVPAATLFDRAASQADALLGVATELWKGRDDPRINRDWLQNTVVRGCFPLHPLTTYCLPLLNNVLAQNERTMFRFIQDDEKGLRHFIQHSPADPNEYGWLPLLALDGLFPYFEPTLKEKREDLWQVYQDGRSRLTAHEWEHGLEGRALRALLLLEVATGDPKLRASAERLSDALSLPRHEAEPLLNALTRLEALDIAYPMAGFYQLNRPGQANPRELRRRIMQRAQDLSLSVSARLNRDHAPNEIVATQYNTQRNSKRSLTALFASLAELNSPAIVDGWRLGRDGVVVYIVTTSTQEIEEAQELALRLTRSREWLLIAIPRTPTEIVKHLKLLTAVTEITRQERDAPQAVHEIFRRFNQEYLGNLTAAVASYDKAPALSWYWEGALHPVGTPDERSALASRVMEKRFPYTPSHQQGQHLKPGNLQATMRTAIKSILTTSPVKLSQSRSPAPEAVLRHGAVPLGLLAHVRSEGGYDEYEVREPSSRDSRRVWEQIESALKAATPWSQLVTTLVEPPFGLYPSLLALFLAAFFRLHRDSLTVFQRGRSGFQQIDVTDDVIGKMVEKPGDYQVTYDPLPHWEQLFLTRIEQALPDGSKRWRTGSVRAVSAMACQDWAAALSPLAQSISAAELATLNPATPETICTLAPAFRHLAGLKNQDEVASALKRQLPSLLGLPEDPEEWEEADVLERMATLRQACLLLSELPQNTRAYLSEQVGRLFGATEPPQDERETFKQVRAWRDSKLGRRNLGLSSEAGQFISLLRNNPYSFEQLFLDSLALRWTSEKATSWKQFANITAYLRQLERVVAEVERAIQQSGEGRKGAVQTIAEPPPTSYKVPSPPAPVAPVPQDAPPPPVTELPTAPLSRAAGTEPASGSRLMDKLASSLAGSPREATVRDGQPITPAGTDAEVQRSYEQISPMLERLQPAQRLALLALLHQKYGQP